VIIDSRHNQHVKFFRELRDAKGRAEHGAFLAEGARLIGEALAAEWPIVAAAVSEELAPAAAEIARALGAGPWPCHEMSARAFRALSDEQAPQGVAIAPRIGLARLDEIEARPADVLAVAWELRDPGNMGTLIRTAEFLGCKALIAVGDCVDFFEPKVVRATAGAVFHLPLAEATEAEFWAWAQERGVTVAATVAEGGAPPEDLESDGPLAVLIGNEAHGLPESVAERAGARITIPRGGRLESLNAGVAAGIVLYAATRQGNNTGKGEEGEE
jgi:TrmH family RNA methyltransferase